MIIRFEELAAAKRLGGIDSATTGVSNALARNGVNVERSSQISESSLPPNGVHVHGIWSGNLIRRWHGWQKNGIPVVASTHGMLEPWALAHKGWKKRAAWWIYQKRMLDGAACLHATSAREAENLRRLGLRRPIAVIPWGIDSQKHQCQPVRERVVLFVGRIYPVKGLPLLLRAWAAVRPMGWRLRLVGPDEGGHLEELIKLVEELAIGESVTFTGPMGGEALATEYRGASLFVLPSHTENFGMVVGEAMAHGLPVIATHGAPWELLETEKCGWWVPISAEGIANALANATGLPSESLIEIGARGQALVAERFEWDGIARRFIDCYRWLLGEDSRPDFILK